MRPGWGAVVSRREVPGRRRTEVVNLFVMRTMVLDGSQTDWPKAGNQLCTRAPLGAGLIFGAFQGGFEAMQVVLEWKTIIFYRFSTSCDEL